MRKIRVMVAEDEWAVREAIVGLIAESPRIQVVAAARDAAEAVEVAASSLPDVALVDVHMPGGGGPRAAREIRRLCPTTRVIALSAHRDRGSVLEMLRAGAVSYVLKDAPPEELVGAILASVDGEGPPVPFAGHAIRDVDARVAPEEVGARLERIGRVLEEGSLSVVFQPVVHLATGEVVGFEALARFPSSSGPSPETWFAEAATVGMLVELELASTRTALAKLDRFPPGAALFVNVSPVAVTADGLQDLLLEQASDRLVIEVTEQAPVHDYGSLRAGLARLREAGIRLAVDDAGAGFASWSHVLELSPDFIKVDRRLIDGIDEDEARRALVAGLGPMAASLGATVIAEGIETRGQLEALRRLRVPLGQGFALGRPRARPVGSRVSLAHLASA